MQNLSVKNFHTNDANIKKGKSRFQRYLIKGSCTNNYISVTALLDSFFNKFNADEIIKNMLTKDTYDNTHKYWGMSPPQIKEMWLKTGEQAALDGTNLHALIERVLDQNDEESLTHFKILDKAKLVKTTDLAYQEFVRFLENTPTLKPFRVEWMVYHEESKIVGTIDAVYINEDGTLSLYDWKRKKEISKDNFKKFSKEEYLKHIPECDYEKCRLQLNMYKTIIERSYGFKVKEMKIVRFYPQEYYEIIDIPNAETEMNLIFGRRVLAN